VLLSRAFGALVNNGQAILLDPRTEGFPFGQGYAVGPSALNRACDCESLSIIACHNDPVLHELITGMHALG
jgi:hypothetical protein